MEYLGKGKVPIKGWTKGVPIDKKAIEQLVNAASLPFIHKHIAVMPDAHWGMGSTVGSVIPTKGAIIPAAVGVDIGCGMLAVKTNIRSDQLPDSLVELRSCIESKIPHGRTDNGGVNDRGAWSEGKEIPDGSTLANIVNKHPKLARAADRSGYHIGTLGTGNHFIEICLDENDDVWVMLHSGSRGVGNRIGSYFTELAKQDMRRYFINLPDMDLAYLIEGSESFDDYVEAVGWAQNFAKENRESMKEAVFEALNEVMDFDVLETEKAVNCHHNYVERENHFGSNVWLTRKGAVRARKGDLGIIPGSMGAKSFIVRGKGNKDSFCSCSHGAGRVMSRGQARKEITLEDHIRDTQGVECRKDADVIDESPKAYKDIEAVMKAQEDLVEIVHTLKQVLCVKG